MGHRRWLLYFTICLVATTTYRIGDVAFVVRKDDGEGLVTSKLRERQQQRKLHTTPDASNNNMGGTTNPSSKETNEESSFVTTEKKQKEDDTIGSVPPPVSFSRTKKQDDDANAGSALHVPPPRPESPIPPEANPNVVIEAYSYAKPDRFGSSLLDQLGADAYAFAHNWTYVGACRTPAVIAEAIRKHGNKVPWLRDIEKKKLLARFGFTEWKPYGLDCPLDLHNMTNTNATTTGTPQLVPQASPVLVPEELYRNDPFLHFSPAYIRHLHQRLELHAQPRVSSSSSSSEVLQIAVHMRRGDIRPCGPNWSLTYRYLTNSYYQRMVDTILLEQPASSSYNVTVYTEPVRADTLESYDEFRDRGYHVVVGGDEFDVWQDMIHADALVMSQSFFSGLPGMLNARGKVYAPPPPKLGTNIHIMTPLSFWIQPSAELVDFADEELGRLQDLHCPGKRGRYFIKDGLEDKIPDKVLEAMAAAEEK